MRSSLVLEWVRRFVRWRWYTTFVLATWVFTPEIRRLVDWQTSFHALSPFSIVPILVLLPAVVSLPSSWARVGQAYRQVSRLWFIAFGYAFIVSYVSGTGLSALFDLTFFLVPFLLGLVLAASPDEDLRSVFERNVNSMLWIAAITSLYGIYQYVSPPPWDVYWAQQANVEGGQGITAAFSFRIFGTLNSTGPLAEFLDFAILLNLPRLSRTHWWVGLLLVPCALALALTEVRAEWLALALAIVVYLVLSPKRGTVLLTLGAVSAAFVLVGSLLLTLVNSEGANATAYNLSQRISTFGTLGSDSSTISRQSQTDEGIAEGWAEPLGQGLGASGGSTKLAGGNGGGIDNGIVARFFEMGVFGFCAYELALLLGIVFTWRAYWRYSRGGAAQAANYLAVAVAAQISLLAGESSTDHHRDLLGLFFWFSLFLASAFVAPSGVRVQPKERHEPMVLARAPSRT